MHSYFARTEWQPRAYAGVRWWATCAGLIVAIIGAGADVGRCQS